VRAEAAFIIRGILLAIVCEREPAILCVNDNSEQLKLLEGQLRQAGYRVFCAPDGVEAIESARREPPDLIISDVVMRRGDGIELCRAVRADADLSDTPIVLLSAMRGDERSVVDGLSAGADEYLEAPCGAARLVALASRLVERKRAADALRESEGRYRVLFERSPLPMWVYDLETFRFLDVNSAAVRHYGYSREEFLGMTIKDIRPPAEVPVLLDDLVSLSALGYYPTRMWTHLKKDGTPIDVEITGSDFNFAGVRSRLILVNDITERRRIEAERHVISEIIQGVNTTQNLDELLRLVHTAIGRIIYAENCFVALHDKETGYFHMPFHVDERDPACPPWMTTKGCTAYVFHSERPLLADAETFRGLVESGKIELVGTPPVAWMGVPLRTPSEVIGALVVQSYDEAHTYGTRDLDFLTSVGGQVALAIERKRAEESLARLAAAVEQTADSIMITDAAGAIQYVNPAFERVSGYARDEALGRNPRMLKSGKVDASVYREMWATLARGEVWDGHFVNKRKDGSLFEESVTISPVRDAAGEVMNYIAVKHDLTQQKRLEEQLLQSQKMEAVGRLAGGVAHDFNNLLVAINGYSELTLRRLPEGDPLRRNLEEIRKAGERAAALTRQLLAFSRKQVLQPKVVSLNDVVADIDKILRRVIGEDLELATVPDPGLGHVKADPNMLEQVVLNLCVNARDAMPRGGHLTVETENVFLEDEYAARHVGVRPGAYVVLSVTDTGTGMDEETRRRVFEPFFTTKEVGKGTGLGLSTVYGIVRQSGGNVCVYSEVGRGSVFKVYLPRVDAPSKECAPERDSLALPAGEEKILLVEDDRLVRNVAREIITLQGYTVLEAATQAEALRHCAANPDIALLLTDVVMPQVNGKELAGRLTALLPAMHVLFMSGYSETVVHDGVLEEGLNFIQKPFTPAALLRKLREVLDSPPVARPSRAGLPSGDGGS
jgi:two-component system cell cycle sensor histidine kinase/response regulator CckA